MAKIDLKNRVSVVLVGKQNEYTGFQILEMNIKLVYG